MAIIKTPAAVQPAFNEVVFIDNTRTELTVSGVSPSPELSLTFRRIRIRMPHPNGSGTMITAARFNARALVSRLFVDKRIHIPPEESADVPEWCFEDYNLKAIYKADNKEYLALNAVRQIGEELDMYRMDRSPIMTDHADDNGQNTIPIYEGFPAGFTVMQQPWHDIDLSKCLVLTVNITQADTTLKYRLQGSGFILWGDNSATYYGNPSLDYVAHTYSTIGRYQIVIQASEESIFLPYQLSSIDEPYSYAIVSIDNWGDMITVQSLQYTRNLESIPDEPLPATVSSLDDYFFYTPKLTSIPVNIFENIAPNILSAERCFCNSGITEAPSGLFAGFSKCVSFQGVFESSRIRIIGDNIFSGCESATDFTEAFASAQQLGEVPATLFAGCINAETFEAAFWDSAIYEVPTGLFDDCINVRDFQFAFADTYYLQSIPVSLFDNNKLANNFEQTFARAQQLRSGSPKTDGLALWERAGQPGYPDVINGARCFRLSINMEDYADIPDDWK